MKDSLDWNEIGKRALKYIIEGLMVALAAFLIPGRGGKGGSRLGLEEIAIISLTAAATFAFLDFYAPSISTSARQGAGFGIGANLVGWPAGALPMA